MDWTTDQEGDLLNRLSPLPASLAHCAIRMWSMRTARPFWQSNPNKHGGYADYIFAIANLATAYADDRLTQTGMFPQVIHPYRLTNHRKAKATFWHTLCLSLPSILKLSHKLPRRASRL
jgi:hypothetical protein